MSAIVLQTKLNIPQPRLNLVTRSRLAGLLHDSQTARFTLVSAPAGFGKTTLLSIWAQEAGRPAAWLSLGAEDNDPVSFLTYLVSALQRPFVTAGRPALAMLQTTPSALLNQVIIVLINEMAGIGADFLLFLDDYHFIENQEVHDTLAYLIENAPLNMHLILATRSDPPLPLSRLRVRDQLREVRQADLRFTTAEAAAFLNQSMGLPLSGEQVAALEARTEGWIAGLQLAALSLQGKRDAAAFIRAFSGSHRFVIDYLADEILSQQPAGLRQFLQQTAIFDRLTAPLCDWVTGRSDSAAVLQQLEENNLFLIPLDERRAWYRYHHLFSDFLRIELDAAQAATLHQKAAGWFLSQELYTEGVYHALASGDVDEAEKAITRAAPVVFNQGALNILVRWLDALPEERVLANVELAIYKGFALFLAQSEEKVPPYLQAAAKNLPRTAAPALRGRLLSLQAHLALCEGQIADCIRLAKEALASLPETDRSFRNFTFNALGQAVEMQGDVAAAAAVYDQAFRASWQTGDQMGTLLVFTNLIFALNELARRQEALDLCAQLAAEFETVTVQGFSLANAVHLSWSLLSLEANELDVAQEQAQRALDILTAVNFTQGILWGQYLLAQVYLAQGEMTKLFAITGPGIRLARRVGRGSLQGAWLAALEAEAYLQQGQVSKTAQWAVTAGYSPQTTPPHWHERAYFTFTRLLLAQERQAEALELLKTMGKAAEQGRRMRKLISIYLLQARTLLDQGKQADSLKYLQQALQLAAPENYRRAFLDEGPEIAHLLPQVRADAPLFVDGLLAAFGVMDKEVGGPATLVDPLSERELEVLGLVAQGFSNRQIAETLFVTVGTVKKHLNNIFGKLGVKSRTQAMIRANELDLLNDSNRPGSKK